MFSGRQDKRADHLVEPVWNFQLVWRGRVDSGIDLERVKTLHELDTL